MGQTNGGALSTEEGYVHYFGIVGGHDAAGIRRMESLEMGVKAEVGGWRTATWVDDLSWFQIQESRSGCELTILSTQVC